VCVCVCVCVREGRFGPVCAYTPRASDERRECREKNENACSRLKFAFRRDSCGLLTQKCPSSAARRAPPTQQIPPILPPSRMSRWRVQSNRRLRPPRCPGDIKARVLGRRCARARSSPRSTGSAWGTAMKRKRVKQPAHPHAATADGRSAGGGWRRCPGQRCSGRAQFKKSSSGGPARVCLAIHLLSTPAAAVDIYSAHPEGPALREATINARSHAVTAAVVRVFPRGKMRRGIV